MATTHAVQRLYQERMQRVTRPYLARGANVERCKLCMINAHLCICAHRPSIQSEAAFMLVMYDDEVLKPSNTGRLIADAAKTLGVKTVVIGATKKSALINMLRGEVFRSLARRLPAEIRLVVTG